MITVNIVAITNVISAASGSRLIYTVYLLWLRHLENYEHARRGVGYLFRGIQNSQWFLALSLQMKFIISKENTNTKLSRPLPKTDMLNLDV